MSIIIRAGEPRDAEPIRTIYAQPNALANTLQLPYPSLERWQQYCAHQEPGCHNLVAELDGQVVGQLMLITTPNKARRQHVATFGLATHDSFTRQGVASALVSAAINMCDQWLNIERIELEVYTDNAPAIALYRKFGFEQEGLLRHFAFRNGAYADVYAMSRLHSLR